MKITTIMSAKQKYRELDTAEPSYRYMGKMCNNHGDVLMTLPSDVEGAKNIT